MESLVFELIKGTRENSDFLYCPNEQQLFKKKSSYKEKVYYTCVVNECASRVELLNGICNKAKGFKEHTHGTNEKMYNEICLKNKIKAECSSNGATEKAIGTIFYSEVQSNQSVGKSLSFNKMKRGLTYLRSKVFPTSPRSSAEIVEAFQKETVMSAIGMSRHDVPLKFYRGAIDTEEYSFCVFSSQSIINSIETSISVDQRNYYMDATFSIVPVGIYTQFLIIYVEKLEKVLQ